MTIESLVDGSSGDQGWLLWVLAGVVIGALALEWAYKRRLDPPRKESPKLTRLSLEIFFAVWFGLVAHAYLIHLSDAYGGFYAVGFTVIGWVFALPVAVLAHAILFFAGELLRKRP